MALGIMVYHYYTWTGFKFGAETLLGKIGIYGVSVFYVLSGLTLFIVYHEKLGIGNIRNYFIKRIFRIFPLLWLSIFLSVVFLNNQASFTILLLNLSGLFGFVAPDRYIAVASWSIGNELVFYAFFPLVILLSRKIRFAPPVIFHCFCCHRRVFCLFFTERKHDPKEPVEHIPESTQSACTV